MSKTQVPLMHVTIRRDANTITPVTVPPYELTMLRQMFGKENVSEGEQASVIEVESTNEYERLSAKYGQAKVAKVFGDDEGERLTELVEKAAVKAQKAAAKGEKGDKSGDKAPE